MLNDSAFFEKGIGGTQISQRVKPLLESCMRFEVLNSALDVSDDGAACDRVRTSPFQNHPLRRLISDAQNGSRL